MSADKFIENQEKLISELAKKDIYLKELRTAQNIQEGKLAKLELEQLKMTILINDLKLRIRYLSSV